MLTIYKGAYKKFTISVELGTDAVDLTNASLTFTAKRDAAQDADISAVLRKTIGSGIVLSSDTGVAELTISEADTSLLTDVLPLTLQCDLWMRLNGKSYPLWTDTLVVKQSVTRSVT